MSDSKIKHYWFEPYLQDFFYSAKYEYLNTFVNETYAKELIIQMCNDVLSSSKKTKQEKKDIEKKCYDDCLKIIRDLINEPLEKEERKYLEEYEKNRGKNAFNHPTRERHTKHIKVHDKEKEGVMREYEISLLLLSFIKVEIYYINFFKRDIFENYQRFEKSDYTPLKASYDLSHNKKISKDDFKYLKRARLTTAKDYYNNLTMNIDLWWSLTWSDFIIIDDNRDNFKEVTNKNWEMPDEEEFDQFRNLIKNHYFLYYVYPLYYENKILEQLDEQKKGLRKEIKKIFSKNFKCNVDNKNIQPNGKTKELLLNKFDDTIDISESLIFDNYEIYSSILRPFLIDYNAYKNKIK